MADGSTRNPVPITRLQTAVPGLDDVLGGGLPEYSFTLIAGAPGTGKTTLAQQMMFAIATPERPALHFTVLGEPPLKMLRYQQQFSFFDPGRVGSSVRYSNLSEEAASGDLAAVLEAIVSEVERTEPSVVVVDSFRTIARVAGATDAAGESMSLQGFIQNLALRLTTWQVTGFLVGEYHSQESLDTPVFTVADAILWLHQDAVRNSIVRKIQVAKMRGQAPLPGLHTMRITADGIQVFPRIIRRRDRRHENVTVRLSVGVDALDELLGGGLPAMSSTLVVGPSGSGKSTLGTSFIAAGSQVDEPAVVAVFEERPEDYLARTTSMAPAFGDMLRNGSLEMIYLRPLDLSVDEALLEVEAAVRRTGAKRLLIDSLSGFELALAPTFREDFRESLYRMIGALTDTGVSVLMTAEARMSFTDMELTASLVSFLADNIILQRYVEVDGALRRVMVVVKMRGSDHSSRLWLYGMDEHGLVMHEPISGYEGVITGVARGVPTTTRRDGDPDEEVGIG